ncbi:unnamed protein product, partial [Brenthis ino]
MHILCTICSDLVNQAENIHVTKCGHVFHYQCLSQWISRSKSCPQCRNKVTDKCTYRLYLTISNESTGDDAATLQSRLDDAQLQLRQQKASFKENEEKLLTIEKELKKNIALLKATEKKLDSKESAVSALKDQLEYVKIQNRETQKLKEENESLRNKMQTLSGMEKVLNATSDEVEQMLESYKDVKTVATFATALKRALCESENKKNQSRDKLQMMKQQLATEKSNNAELQNKIHMLEEKLAKSQTKSDNTEGKRKSLTDDSWQIVKKMRITDDFNDAVLINDNNISITSMVKRIENADSPYLCLKQSSLALTALQRHPTHPLPDKNLKPSEYALLNSARNITKKNDTSSKTSIFHKKEPVQIPLSQENDPNMCLFNISYDGLGGHSKLDTFPTPNKQPIKSLVPKLSAKHKLKRPNPVGIQDISKMLEKKKCN